MSRFACAWCGETMAPGRPTCPHCLQPQPQAEAGAPIPYWLRLDLHDDLPSWDEAERRLYAGLADLVQGRTRSLLIIHGWGKSGRGGEIKRRVQQRLKEWSAASLDKAWYPGESLHAEQWEQLPASLQRQKRLREQVLGNPGATLVLA